MTSGLAPPARPPFWRAAFANDVEAMRLLIVNGADPNIPSLEGHTPLMAAAGVGWTANLHRTVADARVETVKLCLELGNKHQRRRRLQLHGAARRGLPRRRRAGEVPGRERRPAGYQDHLRHQRHRHGQRLRRLQQPAACASRDREAARRAGRSRPLARARGRVRVLQRRRPELPAWCPRPASAERPASSNP